MTRSNLAWLSGGLLTGALVAIGIMAMLAPPTQIAGPRATVGRSASGEVPKMRAIYSPKISTDPYVIDEQRKVVEALELQCRQSGERCAEAKQARRWIEDRDGR